MFIPLPSPNDRGTIRKSRAKSAAKKDDFRINCYKFGMLCALAAISLVGASRTVGRTISGLKTDTEITDYSQYPIPGSVYESTGSISFSAAALGINVALSTTFSNEPGGVALPAPGVSVDVTSLAFFDVWVHFEDLFSSIRDESPLVTRVSGAPSEPPADVAETELSGTGVPNGVWNVELLGLEFNGEILGPSGPVMAIFRESPTLASIGQHILTDLSDDRLQIDSFFDVFFELSVDGGPFVPADGPVRLDITAVIPEPASVALVGTIIGALCIAGRRHRRAKSERVSAQ